MVKRALFVLALAATVLSACSGASGRLAVQDAWARPTAAGNNAAVYLLVSNGGGSDDLLLGASAEVSRAVEMHETMAVDAGEAESSEHSGMEMGGDVVQMMPLESLLIPAGSDVLFEPGSYHVMLVDVQQDLVEGDSFMVTLHFEQAGDIEVEVVVGDSR